MNTSTVEIAGLSISRFGQVQLVDHIAESLRARTGGWIVTANADISRLCVKQPKLSDVVHGADIIVADGMPLIWASRIIGHRLEERVCGSDLVWSIAERASRDGFSIFLLGGGKPDTAARAAEELRQRFPGLKIAGTHFPPFGFESDPSEMAKIRHLLEETRPGVVYVALGFPKAEILINHLRGQFPETWWIGVGISLSFIAGELPRAPRWMQTIGLEWLHRLAQEPGRLVKRYLWHDIPYVLGLLLSSANQRLRRDAPRD
jgi:N-acetylglucosaminyldiphosphoundecaprenol N-acetyl-beta-D-mannosaminyltransferase